MSDIAFLETLEETVLSRLEESPDGSYTAELVRSGIRRIAQKVGEEGVEVALAAVGGDRDDILSETADLVYHLLVLINSRGLRLADVVACLESRHKR